MNITIPGYFIIGIGVLAIIVGLACSFYFSTQKNGGGAILSVLAGFIIAAVCIGGTLFYSNTEAGKRAYKDQQSNISGGIQRTVTVYDINGNIIKQYSGEFDVETDKPNYILFDDEDGKRHVIYNTTGTIIIDEE